MTELGLGVYMVAAKQERVSLGSHLLFIAPLPPSGGRGGDSTAGPDCWKVT